MNLDIGHIRNLTWAKDNNQSKWVSYNRMRGQYMSALEHAVPERFFSDPLQCNLAGTTTPVAGLPDCAQGISAVKAIGLATAQGQKIYTITSKVYQNNPSIVNGALTGHSQETKSRVQSALNAGMEVTIHQAPIVESGWKGAGIISIDPQTGAGAYTIEGGSNGGVLLIFGAIVFAIGIYGTAVALAPALILVAAGIFFMFAAATIFQSSGPHPEEDGCNFFTTAGVNLLALALGILITGTIGIVLGVIAALLLSLPSTGRGIGNLCAK